jgi:SAM-dependent methyltransferase
MNEHEYALMRRVEDSYWWYAVLRESVVSEVTAQLTGRSDVRILDAGCGTGGMMEVLRRENPAWQISGLDFSPQAVEHTRERGFTDVTQGSVDALPYPDATFDAVVSLDVLYFDGVDETKAMSEFGRVLKPGGVLVLNLPAFDILRGEHDVAVSGVRRYTPSRVSEMLSQCGLDAVRVHCWNAWLFLPILGWRLLSRLKQSKEQGGAKSDLSMPPAVINKALSALARIDMSLCRAIHSPLGTSVQAVARKTPS